MQVKQITDWIVFGEIKTATKTLIACFISISHPFLNLHTVLTGPLGYITVPISTPCPSYIHTNGNPMGMPHTNGSPVNYSHDISHCTQLIQVHACELRNLLCNLIRKWKAGHLLSLDCSCHTGQLCGMRPLASDKPRCSNDAPVFCS